MKLRYALIAILLAASVAQSSDVDAVGTRTFVLDSLDSFKGGDLEGVAISSDGAVSAGYHYGNIEIPDATSTWATLPTATGTLLATGPKGVIFRVHEGKSEVAAETETMAVTSLATAFGGDVVAGSFPGAKLFRSAPGAMTGGTLKPWVELPDSEDVWAVAYDAKRKQIFAATGPNGKVFRVDGNGKAQVYFDSEEPHIVSLALGEDGVLYAGSSGTALLYAIRAPGRARVVRDFDAKDVKAIAVVPQAQGGGLYAVANVYKDSLKTPPPPSTTLTPTVSLRQPPTTRAGKGRLMYFDAAGRAELMLKDDKTHFVSLSLDDKGLPVVGTGSEGQIFSVDKNHVKTILVDTDSRQVSSVSLIGKSPYFASSDPVAFHAVTGRGGTDAVWTSKVLDAGMRAHFGRLQWRSDGALEIQTRSGNTAKPNDNWSPWSAAMTTSAVVTSPSARYVQVRARWNRDANAVLRRIELAFVTDNARALLSEITVGKSSSDSKKKTVPASGGPLDKPSSKVKLNWKVDNPDKDTLRYRLFYRIIGSNRWYAILPSDTTHTTTSYSWDTEDVPEGRYELRVDASDELANPPDRAWSHSLILQRVLVDNTPPVLSALSLVGGRLKGEAKDGLGPVARIEVAPVGGARFFPIFPSDGVFDDAVETFDADISGVVPPTGGGLLVIRAYDEAGNRTTRHVTSKR
ncbi:MAG: hypothetical protein VB934_04185 [Polyangiaceae bacterium]